MVFVMSKFNTLLCTLALAPSAVLAQAPAPPAPLMHLYPVVLDATGQPVTDLTSADFKITDDNKPETILFFHRPWNEKAAAPRIARVYQPARRFDAAQYRHPV